MLTTWNFNPRPPHGGRPKHPLSVIMDEDISIHALRMEGDSGRVALLIVVDISIHALRREGDSSPASPAGTP